MRLSFVDERGQPTGIEPREVDMVAVPRMHESVQVNRCGDAPAGLYHVHYVLHCVDGDHATVAVGLRPVWKAKEAAG